MTKNEKVALCKLCNKELADSLVEKYCPDCDGEWYCHVLQGEKNETEAILRNGPSYVYGTKNLREAWKLAGPGGAVCAVRRFGDVPVEREFGAWFSLYAEFSRWVEAQPHHQIRGTLPPPAAPDMR